MELVVFLTFVLVNLFFLNLIKIMEFINLIEFIVLSFITVRYPTKEVAVLKGLYRLTIIIKSHFIVKDLSHFAINLLKFPNFGLFISKEILLH